MACRPVAHIVRLLKPVGNNLDGVAHWLLIRKVEGGVRTCPCRTEIQDSEQENQEYWSHLHKKCLTWIYLLLVLLVSLLILSAIMMLLMSSLLHVLETSTKEHVKEVIWVKLIIMESIMILLTIVILCPMLIIKSSFVWRT